MPETRRRWASPISRRPIGAIPSQVRADEVPVFWACGVTPQAVAQASRPPLMITHAPGHMFLTDWRDHQLAGEEPALG